MDNQAAQQGPLKNPEATPIKPHSKIHSFLLILLLFILPPLAWWGMWKNHRYHTWFAYLLWFNGAMILGFSLFILTQLYPLLKNVFDTTSGLFTGHMLLLLFACFEIGYGFYLKRMCKENTRLSSKTMIIVIILLLINTIALPISQIFVLSYTQNNSASKLTQISTPSHESKANWKTYTNNKYGYEIQYPKNVKITKKFNPSYPEGQADVQTVSFQMNDRGYEVITYIDSMNNCHNTNNNLKPCNNLKEWITSSFTAPSEMSNYIESKIDSQLAFEFKDEDGAYVAHKNNVYFISAFLPYKGLTKDNDEIYKKILSTFTFIDQQTVTPTVSQSNYQPVACTMDAKMCPDGGYVGRSGPKCEFAACPTSY